MEKLTINDKASILEINSIEDKYILGENRKVIIFEYFSNFDRSFLFQKVKTLGFDFQIKIKKELYSKSKEELLNSEYINLAELEETLNGEYNIILEEDKENELNKIKFPESVFKNYINVEKGSEYIYRHYIIINIENNINIEKITYDFITQIKDSNSIIRLLKQKDLVKYLQKEIYTKRAEGFENIQNSISFREAISSTGNIAFSIVKKLNNLIKIIEKSFFQQNIENIDPLLINILDSNILKDDNYLKIGNTYKGGLFLKGIPKDNFNILKFLFLYLEEGDSITINMYPEKRHTLEKKELEGVEKYLKKENSTEIKENEIYLQLLVNISDTNPKLLDKKINNFQLHIGEDFYTQRITGVMSRYLSTYIGTGINKLDLEKLYSEERLINNLLF